LGRHRVCSRCGYGRTDLLETHPMHKLCYAATAMVLGGFLATLGGGEEPAPKPADSAKQWDESVDKAVAYFRKTQAADGSWGKQPMGVTGLALTALLKSGKVTVKDPASEKALKYIESLINTKAGHIAGKDPRAQLQNYVTSINVLALTT